MRFKKIYKSKFLKFLLIVFLFIGSVAALSGCGRKQSANTVKVGIVGNFNEKIFKPLAKQMKHQYHVKLKIVDFSDVNQPNQALSHHEIDTNAFQTQKDLTSYDQKHHAHLVSVGKTGIGPITLYSKKIHKLSQIKKGASIAIPNDTNTEGRALNLLASAGLIKTKKNVTYPTVSDITKNPKHLHIKQLDPAQVPRSLGDVQAAVINNVFALDAKLPDSDAIYKEKVNKKVIPYINVIATNKSDKNKKAIKDLVKAYHSKENLKRFKKVYHGTAIPAWNLKL